MSGSSASLYLAPPCLAISLGYPSPQDLTAAPKPSFHPTVALPKPSAPLPSPLLLTMAPSRVPPLTHREAPHRGLRP